MLPDQTAARRYSRLDSWLGHADRWRLRISQEPTGTGRAHPAADIEPAPLSASERRHVAGLMRINHTGEVCAQALYQGQERAARLPRVQRQMHESAIEEEDHLLWCRQRLDELNSHPSRLNPLWFTLSYGLGAFAGWLGDRWSLGFVEETEKQVCKHLDGHMQHLPAQDQRTRRILEQMRLDEAHHADKAHRAGASPLPFPVRRLMSAMSKVMTITAYRL